MSSTPRIPLLVHTPVVPDALVKVEVFSHVDTTEPLQVLECLSAANDSYHSVLRTVCSDAETGFLEWSTRTPPERAAILRKAGHILAQKERQLVDSHLQIGGPSWFAHFNVHGSVDQIEHYAACLLSQPDGVVPQSEQTSLALVYKRPIGPVLSIAPWNAPVILGCRSVVAPLAAGCSVVLKSSTKSPLLSSLIVLAMHEAGIPTNVLQMINVSDEDSPKVTADLLANEHIRMINFTGSTAVGREIAKVAAANLKPSLLELGGKNCCIVEADANLDKCIPAVLANSWWHNGQICMSSDKVYVHASVYEEFKARILVDAQQQIDTNEDLKIPQRDAIVSAKVSRLVAEAVSKGASVVFGEFDGSKILSPVILEGVTADMEVHTEETFGPVFSMYRYDSLDEVVKEVNSLSRGLKAAIWSSNTLKAIKTAGRIQCGGVHINRMSIHDESTIPHGGVKESGHGRFNGSWGLDLFSYIQTVTVDE